VTVGEAIALGADNHPDDELMFAADDGGLVSVRLADLHESAGVVARRLRAAGAGPGDAVVIQAAADVSSTEALIAVWILGAVAVPLVATAGPDELRHVLAETGAAVVVVSPRWRGIDLAFQAVDAGAKTVIVLGGEATSGATALAELPLVDLPASTRPSPGDVAVILYTSGSTAEPKGVQHTHETLLFGLTIVPADSATRMLAAFPAGHVASLLGLVRPLTVGGTTVVMERWSARRAVELIETLRLTTSAGTPFFLQTLLDEADASGRDICSLTRFLCGAAAGPPALVERALERGIVTWRTYGSTEHPAIASGGPDDPPEKRQHTDGRVTPGNEVRLVDEHGVDVEPGEEGEILARGPKQFVGYRNAALDDDAFVDRTWFRTGDLARLDADSYLVVTDRVKDIIIRGGENISAREVEEALAGAPGVAEVAVCPAPDATWGEIVAAVVVPDGDVTLDALIAHAHWSGLAAHKHPARLVVVETLPRTPAGKVRKRDLRPLL
jgi:acyl-CoA synthetase (AMP-forming)/AMP-acid ligase II